MNTISRATVKGHDPSGRNSFTIRDVCAASFAYTACITEPFVDGWSIGMTKRSSGLQSLRAVRLSADAITRVAILVSASAARSRVSAEVSGNPQ